VINKSHFQNQYEHYNGNYRRFCFKVIHLPKDSTTISTFTHLKMFSALVLTLRTKTEGKLSHFSEFELQSVFLSIF